jgi:hypothetical protein
MIAFARKVWKYKSLPPLWLWEPAWLRKLAVLLLVPPTILFFVVLLAFLRFLGSLVEPWPNEWHTFKRAWKGRYPYGEDSRDCVDSQNSKTE